MALLDEGTHTISATEQPGVVAETYSDGAGDGRFAGSVWPDDHVEIRPRVELGVVVGDKVVQLDAHDGAGDVPAR